MPLINSVEVVDRHNRPAVQSRVLLRTYFINDGEYTDPYAISSVHVFKRAQNLSPSSVLDTDGIVASGSTSSAAMVFSMSDTGVVATDPQFASSNYTGLLAGPSDDTLPVFCSGVSGVYKMGAGTFFCVLDGLIGASLSGVDQNKNTIQNSASSTTRYMDIWTVKMTEGSDWSTYINHFELFDNAYLAITEPLSIHTRHKLYNKQVQLGSKTDLKIGTEFTLQNQNIDESIKNTFKQTSIQNARVVIRKDNDDINLPSRVLITSSTDVSITGNNTIIYSLDTANVTAVAPFAKSDIGNLRGTYSLQVEYTLFSEKLVSPLMYFIVK
tara:strand:- start:2808 stop:3785 length:978 start_codon:yes stop_codon:yes gene_type:complete